MQAFLTTPSRYRLRLAALVAVLASVGLLAAGCADDAAVEPTTTTTPAGSTVATAARPAASRVAVYFPTTAGDRIVRVVAPVESDSGSGLEEAVRALVAGPDRADLSAALPTGTRLLGASVDGTTARVDLSTEFAAGYPTGGSAAEISLLAPIVFTATEVAGIDATIVTVDGAVPDVSSQFDLSAPLGRDDFPPEIAGEAP